VFQVWEAKMLRLLYTVVAWLVKGLVYSCAVLVLEAKGLA
jgi:hypothetical protein